MKKQWGGILNKFADIPLLGGIKLNASAISQEAKDEIKEAEEDIITSSRPAMVLLLE